MSTLEEMLGDTPAANAVEIPTEDPKPEVEVTPEEAPEPDEEKSPSMVPLAALQEAREEKRRLMDLLEQSNTKPEPEPEPKPAPDFIAEGDEAWSAVQLNAEQAARKAQIDVFEEMARDKHGDEVVDAAVEAFKGASKAEQQAIFSARNPYRELVKWTEAKRVQAEIGEDPAAYKARIREELKAELAAEAAAEVKRGVTPPASLAGNPSIGSRASAPNWDGPKPLSSIIGE